MRGFIISAANFLFCSWEQPLGHCMGSQWVSHSGCPTGCQLGARDSRWANGKPASLKGRSRIWNCLNSPVLMGGTGETAPLVLAAWIPGHVLFLVFLVVGLFTLLRSHESPQSISICSLFLFFPPSFLPPFPLSLPPPSPLFWRKLDRVVFYYL